MGSLSFGQKKIVPLTPSLELHRLCRRLQKELKRKSQAKAIDVSSVKYRQESRERHLQRWLNFYAMYIYTTIEANVLGQKENRLQNIVNHRRRIHPTQVFQCKVSWEHLFYREHDNRKDDWFIWKRLLNAMQILRTEFYVKRKMTLHATITLDWTLKYPNFNL